MRLLRCCAVQLLGSIAIGVALSVFASQRFGSAGLWAAIIASGAAGLGALVALLVTGFAQGPNRALVSLLAGMVFRLGVPLATGMIVAQVWPAIAEGGVMGMVVVAYLGNLVIETLLAVQLLVASPVKKGVQ